LPHLPTEYPLSTQYPHPIHRKQKRCPGTGTPFL
jgi:hypothetical protein